jgi:uncharacterized protein YfdQ (DUF2303 family)
MTTPNQITSSQGDASAIIMAAKALGAASAAPIRFTPSWQRDAVRVLVPEGYKLESVVPNVPARSINLTLLDFASFVTAVKRFQREETLVSFQPEGARGGKFVAVLDYQEATAPDQFEESSPCAEQVTWPLSVPADTRAWLDIDGKALGQVAFAEFLEDNAPAIVSPDQGDVVEVARTLVAKNNVDWKSGVRLQDGNVQLAYVETTEAKAGQKGDLDIPETIVVALELWAGAPPVHVKARLRYRFAEGKLTFIVRFLGMDRLYRAEIEKQIMALAEKLGRPVLLGTIA